MLVIIVHLIRDHLQVIYVADFWSLLDFPPIIFCLSPTTPYDIYFVKYPIKEFNSKVCHKILTVDRHQDHLAGQKQKAKLLMF